MRKIIKNKDGHLDTGSLVGGFAIAILVLVFLNMMNGGTFPFFGTQSDDELTTSDVFDYINGINDKNTELEGTIVDLEGTVEDYESTDYFVKYKTAQIELIRLQNSDYGFILISIAIIISFSVFCVWFWHRWYIHDLKNKDKIIKKKDEEMEEVEHDLRDSKRSSEELKKKMIQREKTHKEKMTNLQVKLAEKVMQ